jgi:hypothetical protein
MLTEQNIESELSYAYLHAVATRAGFSCGYTNRHEDGAGIDAVIREDGRALAADSVLTSFPVEVQLKATRLTPIEKGAKYSFPLPVAHFEKLRNPRRIAPLLLVVLFLPENPQSWLVQSEDQLVSRRCAYWVSLRGASPSENAVSQTVYIPRSQPLTVEGLIVLMTRISRREELRYEG